ncbi:MAG: DUF4974 domain-containing protein [Chlorobi bacterium]|nr:DUF4974 domain-containing protein [Chlorobiota bacterium]
MNKKQFEILCAKSLAGEIDERGKETLKRLLAESEKLRDEFEDIKKIWNLNEAGEPAEIPKAKTEWLALERRIETMEKPEKRDSLFDGIFSFFQLLTVGKLKPGLSIGFASIILIAGILFFNSETDAPVWITASTQNKEIKEITLPDGSTAKLNSGSEIKFPKDFEGKSREIKLRGEAFFSAVKNGTPFIVITGNSRTTVLGTKFDVRFREGVTKVTVKEGKVKLEPKEASSGGVILTKNLSASILENMKPSAIDTVDADYLTGWLDGKLAFRSSPLKEIVGELERYYDVPVTLSGSGLNSLKLTGTFNNETIDAALSMICMALNLDYSKTENGYLIKAKNNSIKL